MASRLETERLVLTPEVLADAEWLAELFTRRGAGRCTVEEARDRVLAMQASTSDLGFGVLVLRTRATADPLGYCGLVLGRGSLEEPELGYELLPRAHGCGYATEAGRAVLAEAFATGRSRVWATVRPWNTPSFRVLEKLDFRRDHVGRDDDGDIVWLVRDG